MNQKGSMNILVIIIVVALLAGGVYVLATRQAAAPMTTPTPTPGTAPSPTPNPTPTPNPYHTSYNKDGKCPAGYVDYGVPLMCVTPEYMQYCQTHLCPK